jgi:hypothetical protein
MTYPRAAMAHMDEESVKTKIREDVRLYRARQSWVREERD